MAHSSPIWEWKKGVSFGVGGWFPWAKKERRRVSTTYVYCLYVSMDGRMDGWMECR